MASEETPLLSTENNDRDDVYRRFSPTRKNIILVMVSVCGLINRGFICLACLFFIHESY